MATCVRTVPRQPGRDDSVIEPVVLIVFIYTLIVGNETAQAKLQ